MDDRRIWRVAGLVFGTMLSSTLLIPAVRSYVALRHGGQDSVMHAFMSVNMLGAIIGAPLLSAFADRTGRRRLLAVTLLYVDGLLLLACASPLPSALVLGIRALQGAANVAGLSLLLSAVRGSGPGHGKAMGMAGAAIIVAVACGSPLGTLLLSWSPLAPLWVGGALQLVVATLALSVPMPTGSGASGNPFRLWQREPLLRLPTLWITAERFTVGCFVVSFALYAHRVLALSDAQTGLLYSWFLLPFALATYPMGRLAERLDRAFLVSAGTMTYGVMFLLLGVVGKEALPLVLALAGLASAAIYAPSMCFAASLAPEGSRATAMALVNAGGSLGMLLGTALAGIGSSLLLRLGHGPAEVYPLVFAAAGFVQLVVLLGSSRGLRRLSNMDEAERAQVL
jgi:AAHS family 3-hydroxyphenylpropionic acid transporter